MSRKIKLQNVIYFNVFIESEYCLLLFEMLYDLRDQEKHSFRKEEIKI